MSAPLKISLSRLANLQNWRHHSMISASKVRSLASFVRSSGTDLPGPEIWASLVRDYEHVDTYGRRLEAMTPVVTSFSMIAEPTVVLEDDECLSTNVSGIYFRAIDFRVEPFQHGRRYRVSRKRLLGLLRSGNSDVGFSALDSPSSQWRNRMDSRLPSRADKGN
jgi:hypothetical protein